MAQGRTSPTDSASRNVLDGIGWVLWSGTIGLDSPIAARIEAARAGAFTRVTVGPLDVARAAEEGTTAEEVGRMLHDAGLDVVMDPIMGWYGGGPLPGPFAAFRVDDMLRMCEALQVVAMTAIGPVGADEFPFEKLGGSFAALCDRAADFGALVQLEFMPFSAITDLAMATAVVEAAGRANGGVVFDTWHFFRGNPDFSALDRLPGERVFAVQISDAAAELRGSLGDDTFHRMLPGDGVLDLAGAVRALDRIGG